MKKAARAWERASGRPRRHRLHRASALGLALLVSALWPHPVRAACGWTDPTACGVDIQYRLYYFLASLGWFVDRSLLQLAYQLDQMRAWTIEVAFTTLYQMVVQVVSPAYIPVATVALMLACLLLMLAPVTGRTNFLNFRHVLVWLILAPVLLTVGGQMLSQAEQVRMSVSTTFFTAATGGLPGAIFGPAGSDMPEPQPLYPSNPCGSGTLAYVGGTQLHLDALAATLDYADAGDIWCPDARGPSRDIPDGFYITPPGFAYDGNPGDLNTQAEQLAAVDGMQRGAIRTWVSIPACMLAAGESLLNLLLALALALLWLGLPLGLLFVYFQQTSQAVTLIFARAISVLLVSWSSGIALGLLFSCLLAAARLGNAAAYAGLAIGGLVLIGYLLIVAGITLLESLKTLSANVQNATGLSVTQPLEMAAGAAMMATGAGAVGAMGLAASGSTAYGAAAALGRVPGMASLGEVLAGMGELDTEGDLYRGLRAGGVSRMNWGAARRQMAWDAGGQGSIADEQGVVRPERAVSPHRDTALVGSLGTSVNHLEETDLRQGAVRMGPGGQIERGAHLDTTQLAQMGASTIPAGQANVARLLMDGYSVQQNEDGTVSAWKRNARQDALAAIQAAQPGRESTPFRRQLALRSRAAAQRDLYRLDAATAQATAQQLRAAGDTDEAEQWDERHTILERKAERADAIAERGEAGIRRRPSTWTTDEQATRRQVFQTALVEAQGQAQIDRGQIKERMTAAEARLDAIPQEVATIRSEAEQAALGTPPERAQTIQTEAEQQIAARMAEQRTLRVQQEQDAQALGALTPTAGQTLAPAVRRIAADRARQRLTQQGFTQDARAQELRAGLRPAEIPAASTTRSEREEA